MKYNKLKGKFKGAKLPLELVQYNQIRQLIRCKKGRNSARNLLLINMQVNTSLRAGDLLKLTVGDVFNGTCFVEKLWLEQTKTKQQTLLILLECIQKDLQLVKIAYEKAFGSKYFKIPTNPLFPSLKRGPNGKCRGLAYSSYFILFKTWIKQIGLNPNLYGTHSLRAAIPLEYYRKTGDPFGASKLFGHSQISTTSIYLEEIAKERASKARYDLFFDDAVK